MAPLSTSTYGQPSMADALGIPPGTMVDGAVAEFAQAEDGTITADIRINGPAVA